VTLAVVIVVRAGVIVDVVGGRIARGRLAHDGILAGIELPGCSPSC
jgi:hypothetical protein